MQDSQIQERSAHPGARIPNSRVRPSSSKMLINYLADVEQLLDVENWDAAVRESLDLPQIVVALSDPRMRASGEKIKKWCAAWIRAPHTDADVRAVDHERVLASLLTRIETGNDAERVPTRALRQLRLRRLARTPPNGFSSERARAYAAEGNEAVAICTTVLDAVRRWYADEACSDPVVQANLGRLAILR